MARHLNLDLYKIVDLYGNISEEGFVIEPYEKLVVFNIHFTTLFLVPKTMQYI